jgi:predicted nucleic acid-binding Zn ribbon protein
MHAADYRDQQPGLEVVQTDELEAVQVDNQASRFPLPQVSTPSDGLVPLPTDVDTKSAFSSSVYEPNQQPLSNQQVAKERSRRRRRRLLWIAAPILLLVIIGAVVGGVVGSRSKNRGTGDAAVTR